MKRLCTALIATLLDLAFLTARADSQPAPANSDLQSLAKALSGTWQLKVQFEPSSNSPKGVAGSGEESWRAGPDGLTLTDEESFTAGRMKMTIVGLFWTDHTTHQLLALDCNNQNPHTCGLKDALDGVAVHWDGTELIVEEKESSPEGKQMISRVVWSNLRANSFTETGYLGPPGGPFKKGMQIEATRK